MKRLLCDTNKKNDVAVVTFWCHRPLGGKGTAAGTLLPVHHMKRVLIHRRSPLVRLESKSRVFVLR